MVARWTHVVEFGDALRAGRLDEKVKLVLADFSPAQSIAFVHCFTDYNNIKSKVQDHCLLELWSVFALFYAQAECGLDRSAASIWGFLSAAVDYLVQNTFYISLIIIKAVKNRLISINKSVFESYVKALQRFNYETGIPLIKTMKVNNELITYNLRRACEGLSTRLQMVVERFTDQRLTPNCEFAFEQSALEFWALLKKSEPFFPAQMRGLRGRARQPSSRLAEDEARAPPARSGETVGPPQPAGDSPRLVAKTRTASVADESAPNIYKQPPRPSAEEPRVREEELSPTTALPPPPPRAPLAEMKEAARQDSSTDAARSRPRAHVEPVPLPELHPLKTVQNENFPRKCNRKYTLVLDLDETLIHFKNDISKPKFLIRPNAYNFLKSASKHYEIIIFTAAQKEYADWILDKIDSKNNIVYRLYREHCQMSKTSHLKDLGVLGRDLSKTIIVDNFPENFALHKENGICIRSWYGDLTDNALFVLEKFLGAMAEAGPSDVRRFMKAHIENNPEKGFFRVY